VKQIIKIKIRLSKIIVTITLACPCLIILPTNKNALETGTLIEVKKRIKEQSQAISYD